MKILWTLALAAAVAAGSQQAFAQATGAAQSSAGSESTGSAAPGAANPLRETGPRRQSIRALPLDIKLGESGGISLPPSEPEAPEPPKADAKAQDGAPKTDAPGAAEKRN